MFIYFLMVTIIGVLYTSVLSIMAGTLPCVSFFVWMYIILAIIQHFLDWPSTSLGVIVNFFIRFLT